MARARLVAALATVLVTATAASLAGCASADPDRGEPAASTTTEGPRAGEAAWWRPSSASPLRLAWVLDGPLDVSDPAALTADVYDIDPEHNPPSTVALLHGLGKKVVCYIDAGVYEDYRPDASRFPRSAIGRPDEGWDGSYWLDIRQVDVLEPIMRDRIARCARDGYDAVEPDEITGWSNDSGFPLGYGDQIAYNTAVASWVHDAGLSVGLKGDIEQAHDLAPHFDWTLNEDCYLYAECTEYEGGLANFSDAAKAVWIAEYPSQHEPGAFDWEAVQRDAASHRWNVATYELGLPTGGRVDYPTTAW